MLFLLWNRHFNRFCQIKLNQTEILKIIKAETEQPCVEQKLDKAIDWSVSGEVELPSWHGVVDYGKKWKIFTEEEEEQKKKKEKKK